MFSVFDHWLNSEEYDELLVPLLKNLVNRSRFNEELHEEALNKVVAFIGQLVGDSDTFKLDNLSEKTIADSEVVVEQLLWNEDAIRNMRANLAREARLELVIPSKRIHIHTGFDFTYYVFGTKNNYDAESIIDAARRSGLYELPTYS